MNGYGYVSYLKIQPNTVTLYRKWEGERSFSQKNCDLLKNFEGKKTETTAEKLVNKPYSGQMTKTSRKNLVNAINLFTQAIKERWIFNPYAGAKGDPSPKGKRVKHKFSFITLTIPDQEKRVSGKDGYNMLLEPFIFWLVKTMKVNTYIWKAELQSPLDFNGKPKKCKGQLHYHLFIPNWIDKNLIRNKWNTLLRKNDLNGIFDDPPSTAIEKPYKGKNTCDYIVKEIAKNCNSSTAIWKAERELKEAIEIGDVDAIDAITSTLEQLIEIDKIENQSLNGKIWGCSNNLKPKKIISPHQIDTAQKIIDKIEFLKKEIFDNKEKGEKLASDKAVLFDLKKRLNELKVMQKKCYEIEYTEEVYDMLNNIVRGYRFPIDGSKDWVITNYKNDYVEKWTMPNGYHKKLLECKQVVYNGIEGVATRPFIYDYEEFIAERVGKVSLVDHFKNNSISFAN